MKLLAGKTELIQPCRNENQYPKQDTSALLYICKPISMRWKDPYLLKPYWTYSSSKLL